MLNINAREVNTMYLIRGKEQIYSDDCLVAIKLKLASYNGSYLLESFRTAYEDAEISELVLKEVTYSNKLKKLVELKKCTYATARDYMKSIKIFVECDKIPVFLYDNCICMYSLQWGGIITYCDFNYNK